MHIELAPSRGRPAPQVLAGPKAEPALAVDLGPIVSKLSTSLGGSVPVPRIEALIAQLLEQEFSDARVTAFLPIFLHRYALEALRSDAHHDNPPETR